MMSVAKEEVVTGLHQTGLGWHMDCLVKFAKIVSVQLELLPEINRLPNSPVCISRLRTVGLRDRLRYICER